MKLGFQIICIQFYMAVFLGKNISYVQNLSITGLSVLIIVSVQTIGLKYNLAVNWDNGLLYFTAVVLKL